MSIVHLLDQSFKKLLDGEGEFKWADLSSFKSIFKSNILSFLKNIKNNQTIFSVSMCAD